MKIRRFSLLFFFVATMVTCAFAQLPKNTGTDYVYYYKLNKEQVRWMIDSPWISNHNWIFTSLVDSGYNGYGFDQKKYRRGYYISVWGQETVINSSLHIHQPFYLNVQETNGEWWFVFKDTLQSIAKNGKLTLISGGKKAKDTVFSYDSSCMCYPVPKQKKDRWFLFEHNGDFFYAWVTSPYKKVKKSRNYNEDYDYSYGGYGTYRYPFYKRWWNALFRRKVTPMQLNPGYMVVNQPEFRHYDTLKMKTFLVNRRGKPLKKDLYVKVYKQMGDGKQLVWQKVKPLTRGAYTFEMAIPDSFGIDQYYTIAICDKKGREYKQTTFKVADYELKKVTYTWENKQAEYYRGDKILFYAKAVDANNLPLPDATVNLRLWLTGVGTIYDTLLKLPDSAFRNYFDTTLACSPDGLTPVELPGWLVPNADITVSGKMIFTNADNQPGEQTANFQILANSRRYYMKPDSNGLRMGYLVQGKDQHGLPAFLWVSYVTGVKTKKQITLPYYQDWEPGAQYYTLGDSNNYSVASYNNPTSIPKQPVFLIEKTYDSLHIDLENPLGIELGWKIYYGKKLIYQGAGRELSYHIKNKGDKPVYLVYSYTWAGNFFTYESVAWVKEKQLTVKINQPETVYPGQEIPVEIEVVDYKNRAAKNVNLTAYSVNMEFPDIPEPIMPYYGKLYGGRLSKTNIFASTGNIYNRAQDNIFGPAFYKLGFDRHPYYKLLFNKNSLGFLYDTLLPGKSQLSVYVNSMSWAAKGHYAVWVDDTMVYYHVNNTYTPNAYWVTPGRHNIKVRSGDALVEIKDVDVRKDTRTLLGINIDSVYNNNSITRTYIEQLTAEESRQYEESIFFLASDGIFSSDIYIRQGEKLFKINQFPATYITYKNNDRYKTEVGRSYYPIAPLHPGMAELIYGEKIIQFYFTPGHLYRLNGGQVMLEAESVQSFHHLNGKQMNFNFYDSAVELPPAPPKTDPAKNPGNVHKVQVKVLKNPLDHPSIRNYSLSHYDYYGRTYMRLNFKPDTTDLEHIWFINNDSLELSQVIRTTGYRYQDPTQFTLKAGNYDIVLITDSNDFKIIRNWQLDSNHWHYWKPGKNDFAEFDSITLWPYMAKVKLLTRGLPVPFYKQPVKVNVKLQTERAKLGEKVIGELVINGNFVSNALIVLEDKGRFVAAGLTNQFGFYQVPAPVGVYTLKVYTPQWDMFYVENVSVRPFLNTIAEVAIVGYTSEVYALNYDNLSQYLRTEQLNSMGGQPTYENTVNAGCTGTHCGEIKGRVTDGQSGEPIPYATVAIAGTNIGAATDDEGYYRFKGVEPGTYSLEIKYIGYQTTLVKNIKVGNGQSMVANVQLRELVMEMNEVMVTGDYELNFNPPSGISHVYRTPPAVMADRESSVAYKIDGVSLGKKSKSRSLSTPATEEGKYIDENDDIFSNQQLANVSLVDRNKETDRMRQMTGDTNAMKVRKVFRDYGYWIPNMITNKKGKAGFTVRLPDNQTQWITYVPAMDGKRRTGLGTGYIKAYKPLTANLGVPRFMVMGDRLEINGKTVNYTADSLVVRAIMKVNNEELYNRDLGLRYYEVVKKFITATSVGMLPVHYSIKQQSTGYVDGEERTIEVLENGILIPDGETTVLEDDTAFTLLPKEGQRNRTLILSNRRVELLQSEIDKLTGYRYGCVEQTASKLKALLLEKQYAADLNKPFTGEKQISICIRKLEKYQNSNGSWGWWERTYEIDWITLYAAEALFNAVQAGYRTAGHVKAVQYLYGTKYNTLSMLDRLKLLDIMLKMGMSNVKDRLLVMENLNLNLQERFLYIKIKQSQALPVSIDTVLKTLVVNTPTQAAWGQKVFNISVNQLQTSAIAYEILRKQGGYDTLLLKVRNYFMAQPLHTRNTIESATLLQTFIADLAAESRRKNELETEVLINGKKPEKASVYMKLSATDTISVSKKGSDVYYLYSWDNLIADPVNHTEIFELHTQVVQNDKVTSKVEAGKPVTLKVEVIVREDREYVMIEVPIPAGFSYRSKHKGHSWLETHREHFDEKTTIFLTKMPRGKYLFEIQLLPKFKGEVTLLPAKAEEMYFPMRYGNTVKSGVEIY